MPYDPMKPSYPMMSNPNHGEDGKFASSNSIDDVVDSAGTSDVGFWVHKGSGKITSFDEEDGHNEAAIALKLGANTGDALSKGSIRGNISGGITHLEASPKSYIAHEGALREHIIHALKSGKSVYLDTPRESYRISSGADHAQFWSRMRSSKK